MHSPGIVSSFNALAIVMGVEEVAFQEQLPAELPTGPVAALQWVCPKEAERRLGGLRLEVSEQAETCCLRVC